MSRSIGRKTRSPGAFLFVKTLAMYEPEQRRRDGQQDDQDDDLEDVLGHQSFSGAMSA